MKEFLAKLSEKAKAFGGWLKNYFNSLCQDRSKLILTIILAVAIVLSCVAIISFGSKIVNGIGSIFSSDEKADDKAAETPFKEGEKKEDACEHCVDGRCIHCTNGTLDCPDCEDGVCKSCNGEKENQHFLFKHLFDNCTSCKGSGICDTCEGNLIIDCKYCTDGLCNDCAPQE